MKSMLFLALAILGFTAQAEMAACPNLQIFKNGQCYNISQFHVSRSPACPAGSLFESTEQVCVDAASSLVKNRRLYLVEIFSRPDHAKNKLAIREELHAIDSILDFSTKVDNLRHDDVETTVKNFVHDGTR